MQSPRKQSAAYTCSSPVVASAHWERIQTHFQQTKSGPKATNNPFTVGKAKTQVRKTSFTINNDMKRLLIKGNYLQAGKEGRSLGLALTAATKHSESKSTCVGSQVTHIS